ncbi:MAG: radical SAM protein [bacterium]
MNHLSNLEIFKKGDRFLAINPTSGKWNICSSYELKESICRLKKFSIISSSHQKERLICVFHLTNKCNLECKYCYADIGTKGKNILSNDAIMKILDILASSLYESVLIEFHGGEPLLCWEEIKDIILKYHNKRNFYFGIQTNGTLLTPKIIDFIKMYSIGIGISIDGPQEIHDRNRCYPNGKGSFSGVMRGISLLKQNKIPFTTISVVERSNECSEIFDFFVNNQIERIKLNPLYFKGMLNEKNISSYCLGKYQEEFATEHLKIARKIIEYNKTSSVKQICANITIMVRNLIGNNGYMCLKSPCGAGNSIIMFDENGNIYPCEEMYGRKDFIITNINNINNGKDLEEALRYSPIILKIKERKVENIPKCRDCIWQRFCGGGCTSYSLNIFNSLKREDVMCQYNQIMFEGLMWILGENKDNVILLTKPEAFK